MGTDIQGTFRGKLFPDGTITNATITPDRASQAPVEDVAIQILRPPSLPQLLQEIENSGLPAAASNSNGCRAVAGRVRLLSLGVPGQNSLQFLIRSK